MKGEHEGAPGGQRARSDDLGRASDSILAQPCCPEQVALGHMQELAAMALGGDPDAARCLACALEDWLRHLSWSP